MEASVVSRDHRVHAVIAMVLVGTATLLCVFTSSAGAATTHLFKETFGSATEPSFTQPSSLAFAPGGDLVVLDVGAGTISRYHGDGTPDPFTALGTNVIDGKGTGDGTPEEGFSFGTTERTQIAVDTSGGVTDGNIYVTQNPRKLVDVFSATGAHIGRLSAAGATPFADVSGVAVDEGGAIYVSTDFNPTKVRKIHKFVPAANPPTNADHVISFEPEKRPQSLAAGAGPSAGYLFVRGFPATEVTKLDSASGDAKYLFFPGAAVRNIAVNPADGHLFGATTGGEIQEWDAAGTTKPSEPVSSFDYSGPLGIAVDGAGGDVYVAGRERTQVDVYGPTATVPEVATTPPSEVARTTATLNGSVNPDEVQLTECSFEYVEAADYEPGATNPYAAGQSVPCEEPSAAEVPDDGADHAVHADVEGLTLGAEYHYRLVAANSNEAQIPGEDQSFKLESPPVILSQWTASVISTEAVLAASINPEGFPVKYYFEYGLTDEYGQSTPEFNLAGDKNTHSVRTSIEDLLADSRYHYRTVATNTVSEEENAPTFGPDRTFTTYAAPTAPGTDTCPNAALRGGPSAALPDCRAYEMVSPVDKAGSDIRSGELLDRTPVALIQSDPTGDKLTYTSERRFGDAVSQPYAVQYTAGRSADGWSSHGISPPRGVFLGGLEPNGNEFQAFSEDLCAAWVLSDKTSGPVSAPGGVKGERNLYERTNCGPNADSYRTLVADEYAFPQGIADDNTVLVNTLAGGVQIFVGDSERAICLRPDGTSPIGCSAGMGAAGSSGPYKANITNALSADGSRAYWTDSSSGPGAIYLRLNPTAEQSAQQYEAGSGKGDLKAGSALVTNLATESGAFNAGQQIAAASFPRGAIPYGATILSCAPECGPAAESLTLSAAASQSSTGIKLGGSSECTEPEKACTVAVSEAVDPGGVSPELTTQKGTFHGAARDGSRALFSFDPDRASNSVNGPEKDDLYRFDAESETAFLVVHSFLGLLGASDDLSRIYLVSEEALDGAAVAGEPNLYLFEDGRKPVFIATLAEADANRQGDGRRGSTSAISEIPTGHAARISPGGEAALFASYAQLTGYDNTDAENGLPSSEVFRYDAAANSLTCLSCNPSGARPLGREVLDNEDKPTGRSTAARIEVAQTALFYPRSFAADGRRAYFESYEALVPSDVNGHQDVYQWEAPGTGSCTAADPSFIALKEGCLTLISSGHSRKDSSFLDADPDGSDVFFSTEESLVGKDPGSIDIYDARVGGGFAEESSPVPCEGEACQSAPAPPEEPTPGSSAFTGPGDISRSSCKTKARRARRSFARAKTLRNKAKHAGKASRAKALRQRARRQVSKGRRQSRAAKRCRAKARAKQRSRR